MRFFTEIFIFRKKNTRKPSRNIFTAWIRITSVTNDCMSRSFVRTMVPYLGENDMFANIPENIIISKHYRYTPEFTHKHDFFEILCIYDGAVSNQIQGIHHTLHTGDICIIPPNTRHSLGVFDDSLAFNIIVRASTFQSTFFQSLAADSALAKFFFPCALSENRGKFPDLSCRRRRADPFHTGGSLYRIYAPRQIPLRFP
ncbi:hypothetical protein DW074_03355 [Ruminococcus sp. AF46-10NS]|nr:hypothetical protein DW074_03355 [Ruminococcus sp. AF46-10NS]